MKKKQQETEILESKVQPNDLPEGVKVHENGEWYKEIPIDGLDEPLKLFNTLKDYRLEGETHTEYKVRKQFTKVDKKKGYKEMFYNPFEFAYMGKDGKIKGRPYVNENKKDKFKNKSKLTIEELSNNLKDLDKGAII